MSFLFDRRCRVTIFKPVGFFDNGSTDTIEINDLRVSFESSHDLHRQPDTASLTIYNLNENSRGALQTKPLVVTVDAGYVGSLERVFSGDVRWCTSRKIDEDWITTVEVGHGERAYRFARVNRSMPSGVTGTQALREAATAMGLKLRLSATAKKALDSRQFAQGLALYGRASDAAEMVCSAMGMGWTVQDGTLIAFLINEYAPEAEVEINETSGLVGSPELGAPAERGEPPVLELRCLLNPRIRPGLKIHVSSASVTGTFGVRKTSHHGDTGTGADDWYTDIEARPA